MIRDLDSFPRYPYDYKITDHHPKLKWDGRNFPENRKFFQIDEDQVPPDVISLFKSLSFGELAAIATTPNRQLVWMTHDLLYEKLIQLIKKSVPCRSKTRFHLVNFKAVILYCGTRLQVRKALSELTLENIRSYFLEKNKLRRGLSSIEIGVNRMSGDINKIAYNYEGIGGLFYQTEAKWSYALCKNYPDINEQVKKVMANEDRIFSEVLWANGKWETIHFKNQLFWQRRTYCQIFIFTVGAAVLIATLFNLRLK